MSQIFYNGETVRTISYSIASGSEVYYTTLNDEPIEVVDGKLRVNEGLMKIGITYSYIYKDQEYFIKKSHDSTEIFQITD